MSISESANPLRVLTYNIRACLGTDNVRSPQRIADVIASAEPTVVCLQEVDMGRQRSDGLDQASVLGELLDMHWIAAPSVQYDGDGSYGNAVLSREPMDVIQHEPLPGTRRGEPRSAVWTRITHNGLAIDIVNTHISFCRRERPGQIATLLSEHWLEHPDMGQRLVFCGDLNCSPRDPGYKAIATMLQDAQEVTRGRSKTTWPTRRPFRRLDYLFVSPSLRATESHVHRPPEARTASDHYPVLVTIDV